MFRSGPTGPSQLKKLLSGSNPACSLGTDSRPGHCSMIVYQKKLLRIAEYWDGEEPQAPGVDLLRCFQQAPPRDGMICRPFHTILIDLKRDLPELFNQIKRDTRYEIRRAGNQDQLTCQWHNARDRQPFESFCDYYDDFAKA